MKNMFNVLFCKKKGCIKKYTLSVLGYIFTRDYHHIWHII